MAQSPLLLRLVATSVKLATQAGVIVRDIMKKGELNIVDKGINDFQTEADRRVQNMVIKSFAQLFPNITVIGEEDSESCLESYSGLVVTEVEESVLQCECPDELKHISEEQIILNRQGPKQMHIFSSDHELPITVWVDPLDGTSEYTQGLLSHVTVLIGIAVDEKATAGVIHQPYGGDDGLGRTIWGIVGLGTGGINVCPPPTNCRIVTSTRSHSTDVVRRTLSALKADKVMHVGGAGYKVLLLLEGEAHAYIFASSGCKRWDTCAPEAILHAAGGKLTDINGNYYSYDKNTKRANSEGVLATASKEQHSDYLNLIPDDVKNMFK